MEVVLITGAAGFLGSALTIELADSYRIIAIDRRKPNGVLRSKTPKVHWILSDITHKKSIEKIFEKVFRRYGKIDFVLHLAVFWHFEKDYSVEYQDTNIQGTRNIIDLCSKFQCKRLIFASTLSVLSEAAKYQTLKEKSGSKSNLPYARSKITNEEMLIEASSVLPVAIVRIGAVFSEWCELPPLYILIKHWSQRSWMGRVIPGKGNTGFPYVHRDDIVELVKKVVIRNDHLDNCEWFLACGSETVLHTDLYPLVRNYDGNKDPIHLPVWFVRLVLYSKCIIGKIAGEIPDERPWMMDYIDKQWIVDNSYTQEKLEWTCTVGKDILSCMPQIIDNCNRYQESWNGRMMRRCKREYEYEE